MSESPLLRFDQVAIHLARQEIEFVTPLYYTPEPVTARVWVSRLGGSSFDFGSSLADPDGKIVALCETTVVGGNTPQWLITRTAEGIANGEYEAVLLAGSEALASQGVAAWLTTAPADESVRVVRDR